MLLGWSKRNSLLLLPAGSSAAALSYLCFRCECVSDGRGLCSIGLYLRSGHRKPSAGSPGFFSPDRCISFSVVLVYAYEVPLVRRCFQLVPIVFLLGFVPVLLPESYRYSFLVFGP